MKFFVPFWLEKASVEQQTSTQLKASERNLTFKNLNNPICSL
jgi:hypothetical protein